jgi:lipopolysaccharide export system permease protein
MLTRNSEDLFKNAYQMMDVQQLSDAIDSLHKTQHNYVTSVSTFISPYVTLYNSTNDGKKLASAFKKATTKLKYKRNILETIDSTKRHAVLENTLNGLRNAKSLLDNNILLDNLQRDNYLRYGIEYHRKFSLSFACFLLFLIGAPLGAIIRKGGLGLPLVFAVSFFITFMMLNISGEKLVKTGSLSPLGGMWMSTAILAPIAIWLIVTAKNDSKIFTKEWYLKMLRRANHFLKPKREAIGS